MQVVIDERVDKNIENYFTSLGYEIIKVKKNNNVYSEVSSHTDIFCIKIDDILVYQKNSINLNEKYKQICVDDVDNLSYFKENIGQFNVCIIDNYAIHNFKKTNKVVLDILKEKGFNLINVKQEYARCSILPLNNKCCITSDKGIYDTLIKYNFDMIYLDKDELDIKLYNEDLTYSNMYGFIGGCSTVLNDTVIFFGDLNKFKCKNKLVKYIKSKGFKIKDFKNMDVIDYGSCIFLN